MTIIYILAFIALIAVIFGVSMHDAFWGLITFCLLLVLCIIAYFIIWYFYQRTAAKAEFMKSAKGKAIKRTKQEIRRQKVIKLLSDFGIFICVMSPIIILYIFNIYLKEFFLANMVVCSIIAFAPLTILIVVFLSHVARVIINIKKRTK